MDQDTPDSCCSCPNILPFTYINNTDHNYLHKYTRSYIPLEPAFASTTHKAQGITSKEGVVLVPSVGTPFCRGLAYVGMSRATEIDKLFLAGFLRPDHFLAGIDAKEPSYIRNEYKRLADVFNVLTSGPEQLIPATAESAARAAAIAALLQVAADAAKAKEVELEKRAAASAAAAEKSVIAKHAEQRARQAIYDANSLQASNARAQMYAPVGENIDSFCTYNDLGALFKTPDIYSPSGKKEFNRCFYVHLGN